MLPGFGVPVQADPEVWVNVISSITAQPSGDVPTIAAWTRINISDPAAGVKVYDTGVQLAELTLVKLAMVVQGPEAEEAYCAVKVIEPALMALPELQAIAL